MGLVSSLSKTKHDTDHADFTDYTDKSFGARYIYWNPPCGVRAIRRIHVIWRGRSAPRQKTTKADPSFEIGLRERGLGERKLDLASWTSGEFAHLHHEARALHGIELEDERRDFGDKRVSDERSDFVLARASIPAKQIGNGYF